MSGNINIIANADNTGHSTSEVVESLTNVPGWMSEVAAISPERGLFLKIRNQVSKGKAVGVPLYGKFRDANGDPLPSNTSVALSLEPLGEDDDVRVSDEIDNIAYWNQNDITTQRDEENVDSVKVPLKYGPGVDASGRPNAINVNGVDTLYVLMDSAAEISWDHSEFYIDSEAVSQGRNS